MRCIPCTVAAAAALMAGCATSPRPQTIAQGMGAVLITGPETDARTIIAIRDTLNRALEHRDTAPFARYWLPDVHVTGGNGAVRVSRDSGVRTFAQFFADSTFVSGMRTPERIDVSNDDVRRAAEAGRWMWRTRNEKGVTEVAGRYLIYWERVADAWRIRSELYVRTACISGPGCERAHDA